MWKLDVSYLTFTQVTNKPDLSVIPSRNFIGWRRPCVVFPVCRRTRTCWGSGSFWTSRVDCWRTSLSTWNWVSPRSNRMWRPSYAGNVSGQGSGPEMLGLRVCEEAQWCWIWQHLVARTHAARNILEVQPTICSVWKRKKSMELRVCTNWSYVSSSQISLVNSLNIVEAPGLFFLDTGRTGNDVNMPQSTVGVEIITSSIKIIKENNNDYLIFNYY